MSIAANYTLLVNPKWKNTSVHDSLSSNMQTKKF